MMVSFAYRSPAGSILMTQCPALLAQMLLEPLESGEYDHIGHFAIASLCESAQSICLICERH